MNKKLTYLLGSLLLLVSCGNNADEPAGGFDEAGSHTVNAVVRASVADFDGTRAGYEWKDGSVLFLIFSTGDGTTFGNAVYNKTNNLWMVSFLGAIASEGTLKAVYVEGNTTVSGSVDVGLTNICYADNDGTYKANDDGTLTLTCALTPLTARLRFKGTGNVKVNGLKYVEKYDIAKGEVVWKTGSLNLNVNAETGYTDPVYVLHAADDYKLKLTVGEDTYSATTKPLNSGESAWLQIPIAGSHLGWVFVTEDSENTTPVIPEYNGHEYVDLGLPSGLKWATCNVGASLPSEYGDYFAWGETSPKDLYTEKGSATYDRLVSELKVDGVIDANGNLTSSYDAATVNWGGTWRMPTNEEIQELVDNCTWKWATENDIWGCRVIGSNGNHIFFPASGYYFDSYNQNKSLNGYYWSSTVYSSDTGAYSLFFGSSSYRLDYYSRSKGQSVRPVSE